MKKLIFSVAAFCLFLTVNAQSVKTEKYANGNKKSEGVVLGTATVDANASKEVQARQAASIAKDGKWTTWYESGAVRSEENYSNGAMVGSWKFLYENGKTESEIDFTKGTAVYFYQNGTKQSEGGIANGMVTTGKWIGYHDNGQKNYEGSYNAQGQKDGVWSWWDANGKFLAQQTFQNGTIVSK